MPKSFRPRESKESGSSAQDESKTFEDNISPSGNLDPQNVQNVASRFRHLLEPIRDLALNWNVDIAQDLENYLTELELVHISFDGGATTMNFAEAALLIQGSACVYSRKVEYLYQLVFRVMDIIADRQRDQNDDGNKSKEADPEQNFGSEPQFIALDDIPEAKSSTIDLVERDDQPASSAISQVQSPLLLTMSLDADMDDTSDPNKDFRLASASIHSSGALLLDARFASFLDGNFGRRSTWGVAGSVERARAGEQSPAVSLIAQGMNAVGHSTPDRLAMDGIPEFQPEEEYNNVSDSEDAYFDSDDKDLRQSTICAEKPSSAQDRCDGRPPITKPHTDVWCMLNPHDDTSAREKPFRKGRTTRRPKIDCKNQNFDSKMCWAQLSIRSHQTRSLRLPYFPDFASHFVQERNKKLAQKLADARARTVSLSSESMHQLGLMLNLDAGDDYDEVDLPSMEDAGQHEEAAGDAFNADSEDEGGYDEYGAPELSAGESPGRSTKAYHAVKEAGENKEEQSYEDMCKAYVEKYLNGVDAFLQQSGLAARVNEWQSRLEPRLEEEERRRLFDIHVYGEEVIGRVMEASEGTAKAVSFATAVRGLSAQDISRSFLATLQLANDGNIEISLTDAGDRGSIVVSVVSEESRHRAMVTDYVAPSLLSARKKRPKPSAGPAASQVRAARLELEVQEEPEPWPQEAEAESATQASQAPTQDKASSSSPAPAQVRKRAFAPSKGGGKRGKENSVPQEG